MGYRWLEPCAVKVARTVLRRGGSNPFPLFDLRAVQHIELFVNILGSCIEKT